MRAALRALVRSAVALTVPPPRHHIRDMVLAQDHVDSTLRIFCATLDWRYREHAWLDKLGLRPADYTEFFYGEGLDWYCAQESRKATPYLATILMEASKAARRPVTL